MQEYIVNNGSELCAVTETWIKSDDLVTPREVAPPGYNVLSTSRPSDRLGGGIMLIFRENFTVEGCALTTFATMECSSYNLQFDRVCINLNIIY